MIPTLPEGNPFRQGTDHFKMEQLKNGWNFFKLTLRLYGWRRSLKLMWISKHGFCPWNPLPWADQTNKETNRGMA